MKFGKEFKTHLEETLPDWRDKFLCYKPLKKLLKNISPSDAPLFPPYPSSPSLAALRNIEITQPWIGLEEWFVRILNEELEKFNDFYIDKEEDFVIRLQELKERIERAKEKSSKGGMFTSESEFSEEMLDIRKDFVTIHGEMVLLKNYSSLNFAGLVKILKKYDKRTGGVLRLPFTQRALHQPFFTTEPLTRLVRECEANLELLFPLEAEVIESDPQNQTNTGNNTNAPETSSFQEDTMDIYRSTLAAMRAIQGLRRASSTCNPLSFASFFQNQDEDGTGAVTDDNSVSNSSPALQNEEPDQDDDHSSKLKLGK
ncbi:SPX domain-containing protein 4 [Magnolia sinica]|uniref:SPX domain-containing protein 4 n=1 Tax=Magnolia sinica TaxID=86752 RepID=UPI0026592624|nr:SPX domain-containing protein 4 [Magnolia sinica]